MTITAINKEVSKKAERRMTIVRGYDVFFNYEFITTPCLRIRGLWMYQAGFKPGDKIVIEGKRGKLTIRKESFYKHLIGKEKNRKPHFVGTQTASCKQLINMNQLTF